MYINGSFSPGGFLNVEWQDSSTNIITTFTGTGVTVTPTQIRLTIPNALFAAVVTDPVRVLVTVHETDGNAQAFYFINPPLTAIEHFLDSGTVNLPYFAPYYYGGTCPYTGNLASGTLPPGLGAGDFDIGGTPLQTGVSFFQMSATDFWGNQVTGNDAIRIDDVPTISQVTPGNSGTGAGDVTITVNGTNFVDGLTFAGDTLPGSTVLWMVNGEVTELATTFVSSTQLTAQVDSHLLVDPASAEIAVQQPGYANSQSLPFAVLAPVIETTVPAGVPAGSNATPVQVFGANYTTMEGVPPTVTLNGIPLFTLFVDAGQLTATVPANMLVRPMLTPTVTLAVESESQVRHFSL